MDIIYGIISVLGNTASFVFIVWFLIVFGKREYRKSVKFLIFATLSLALAVYFNTDDVEMYGRFVYYLGGSMMVVVGFFMLFGRTWKVALTCMLIGVLGVFAISNLFGMKFVSSDTHNKYEDVWNKDPNKWTDDEKEYVNDFFEWQHEYYKND